MITNQRLKLGLVLLMFMLSLVESYSQFLNKGAVWTVYKQFFGGEIQTRYDDIRIERDRIINDTLYSIFNVSGTISSLREDGDKVYYKILSHNKPGGIYDTLEHLLYDFSLNLNDTVNLFLPNNQDSRSRDWIVTSVDSVLIGNNLKRRIGLQITPHVAPGGFQYWIQDVGSTFGPLCFMGISEHEFQISLFCYKINGEKLYGECPTSNSSLIQLEKKEVLLYDSKLSRIKIKLPTKDWCTLNVYTLTGVKTMQLKTPCNQFVHLDNINQGFYIFEVNASGMRYCKKIVVH